jgi:hypothetical protein
MSNEGVIVDPVRRKRLKGCVKVGYAVLREEADEVQPTDGEFALRRGKA